jgi:hypothetical protein
LTIDAGLRFYWVSPITDRDNQMGAWVSSAYDPSQAMQLIRPVLQGGRRMGINPVTGQLYPDVSIGAIAPGVGKAYNGMILATTNPTFALGGHFRYSRQKIPCAFNVGTAKIGENRLGEDLASFLECPSLACCC